MHTKISKKLSFDPKASPYFRGTELIIWTKGNQIWEQNLISGVIVKKATLNLDEIEIVNDTRKNITVRLPRDFIAAPMGKVILRVSKGDHQKSYLQWDENKIKPIVGETVDKIRNFTPSDNLENFGWVKENYNQSPTIVVKQKGAPPRVIYVPTNQGSNPEAIKKVELHYKGALGETLTASLFLPHDFDLKKKYPVVLNIYEKQQKSTANYLLPTFKNGRGFNARLLLESGYMVLIPDISYGDKGSGVSALECIHNVLDELVKIEQVDSKRIALTGQSFGGYQTNFIATHSDRFATFISGASVSDVIHTANAFNFQFGSPDYWRYEYGQIRLGGSFAENKQKYIDNNPLYFASDVKVPMLLWTGEKDDNVDREETRSLFNALRKYRKPVVAVFYQQEGHSLLTTIAQKDLSVKMLEWLDYFLKDKKGIPWIDKQMQASNKQH